MPELSDDVIMFLYMFTCANDYHNRKDLFFLLLFVFVFLFGYVTAHNFLGSAWTVCPSPFGYPGTML